MTTEEMNYSYYNHILNDFKNELESVLFFIKSDGKSDFITELGNELVTNLMIGSTPYELVIDSLVDKLFCKYLNKDNDDITLIKIVTYTFMRSFIRGTESIMKIIEDKSYMEYNDLDKSIN